MNIIKRVSQVFIEISGRCNAKCPYCAQSRLKRNKQFGDVIEPSLFEKILNHLSRLDLIEKKASVILYNWGEPFINSRINDILEIIRNKELYAEISSNFIVKPELNKDYLPIIKSFTFSLSGFSQSTYSRIHGASIEKVLYNFETIYSQLREYSPDTIITINWHRYLFNEHELYKAYKYFNRPGILFSPGVAYLNDLYEMLDFTSGNLSEDRLKSARLDIFLDHVRCGIRHCSKISKGYHCPAWDFLVIDELGHLLLCCGTTRYDADSNFGNILEMTAHDILKNKLSNSLCKKCIGSGLAMWAYNQKLYNYKQLPLSFIRDIDSIEYWFLDKYHNWRSKAASSLKRAPKGEMIIKTLQKFGL